MTNDRTQTATSQDEAEIHALIERWASAVREQDRAAIRRDHDLDMLMFDVPPPLVSRGLDAYMASWDTFFTWAEKPVAFDFHDVKVTCGVDVAFATALGKCAGVDPAGMFYPPVTASTASLILATAKLPICSSSTCGMFGISSAATTASTIAGPSTASASRIAAFRSPGCRAVNP
jgi:ketosteroid isomerase-like protein